MSRDDEEVSSHIVAAGGAGTGINDHSAILFENGLFLAFGNRVCALKIPSLDLFWNTQVDEFTCFGIHLPPRRDCLISHGELEISRLDLAGKIVWQSSGADIFTGKLATFEDHIEVEDWNGWRYRIEMETGESELLTK